MGKNKSDPDELLKKAELLASLNEQFREKTDLLVQNQLSLKEMVGVYGESSRSFHNCFDCEIWKVYRFADTIDRLVELLKKESEKTSSQKEIPQKADRKYNLPFHLPIRHESMSEPESILSEEIKTE